MKKINIFESDYKSVKKCSSISLLNCSHNSIYRNVYNFNFSDIFSKTFINLKMKKCVFQYGVDVIIMLFYCLHNNIHKDVFKIFNFNNFKNNTTQTKSVSVTF